MILHPWAFPFLNPEAIPFSDFMAFLSASVPLISYCLSLEKVDSQSQKLCGDTIVRNETGIMMK